MEDAFAQLQERVFGTVTTFGKQIQSHFVVNHIHSLFDGISIATHSCRTVADAEQRKDTVEFQDLGHGGIGKNVTTSHEHFFMTARCQHHQSIHQCVAMVDSKDQSPVLRQVLLSVNLKTTIRSTCVEIHKRTYDII